jgi:VWFA-related protein
MICATGHERSMPPFSVLKEAPLPANRPRRVALVAALVLTSAPLPPPVRAQAPEKRDDIPTFGVSSELVYVRFHVEKKGGYLAALSKDQIRVLENGRPQTIAVFETPSTRERTVPLELILALDVSASVMDPRLLDALLVQETLHAGLDGQAHVGLCAFGGKLRCLRPPTRDPDALQGGFEEAVELGRETRSLGTRLYSSLVDICRRQEKEGPAQRALIVFSDGIDTQDGSVDDAIEAAQVADVRVYAVKLNPVDDLDLNMSRGGPLLHPSGNRAMFGYRKLKLDDLANSTGGRAYEPSVLTKNAVAKILREIAAEIKMEHVVGYRPTGEATGRKHKVKVELLDKSAGKIRNGERTLVR